MIKTSHHSLKFTNIGKHSNLDAFLCEFNRMTDFYLDYFWNNKFTWKNITVDIKNNKLDVPAMMSTTGIHVDTPLSARALKSACGIALECIRSTTESRRKQLFMLKKLMSEGKDTRALQSKIDSNPLTKPKLTAQNLIARLDSNCCVFLKHKTIEFDGFLKLYSLGKSYGHIYIPVKFTRQTNRLMKKGYSNKTTWQIGRKFVSSIWEMTPSKSTGTKIIGADQGMTTCLSLSDGQTTGVDIHGHDLSTIINKLSRKQKGSKAFKRAQAHRTNYVNWAVKQLNLSDVKELRLEKLFQMRTGINAGRNLSHWTYTAINAQIKSLCQEQGVPVIEQAAMYRSQRCSCCGWTQKANRKGKEFICKSCKFEHDADINGALNHAVDLYPLPIVFCRTKSNIAGFYWTAAGIFDSFGQVINNTVPVV